MTLQQAIRAAGEGGKIIVKLPVKVFRGGGPAPDRYLWFKELDEVAAPFLLSRTTAEGLQIDVLLDVEVRERASVTLTTYCVHEKQRIDFRKWGFQLAEEATVLAEDWEVVTE